jgi:hypothetical protein
MITDDGGVQVIFADSHPTHRTEVLADEQPPGNSDNRA